jgi:hypothetical protein
MDPSKESIFLHGVCSASQSEYALHMKLSDKWLLDRIVNLAAGVEDFERDWILEVWREEEARYIEDWRDGCGISRR